MEEDLSVLFVLRAGIDGKVERLEFDGNIVFSRREVDYMALSSWLGRYGLEYIFLLFLHPLSTYNSGRLNMFSAIHFTSVLSSVFFCILGSPLYCR